MLRQHGVGTVQDQLDDRGGVDSLRTVQRHKALQNVGQQVKGIGFHLVGEHQLRELVLL